MYRVAIDTGGTFTDYIAIDQDGRTVIVKNPTDRLNPTSGIMAGLQQLAQNFRLGLSEFLGSTEQIVHGTTLALNALLEKQGAPTALLTTEGFRDALEIRRSRRADQWDLRAPGPPVLVPRRLRLGVAERLNYRGDVVSPLDRQQLQTIIARLKESEVESVAICFLFSFLNPVHERVVSEILTRELPGVFITASSEIAPRIGEYERASTTVLNAYLTPVLVPRTERFYVGFAFCALGSGGGMAGMDGSPYMAPMSNYGGVRTPNIEANEVQYPHFTLYHEMEADTAGAGRHRGGAGIRYAFRLDDPQPGIVMFGDGMKIPPYGLDGGSPGSLNQAILSTGGRSVSLSSKEEPRFLHPGDTIRLVSSGGGGCGNPDERDQVLVWQDAQDGIISVSAARSLYGVVIGADGIDHTGTTHLREERKNNKCGVHDE